MAVKSTAPRKARSNGNTKLDQAHSASGSEAPGGSRCPVVGFGASAGGLEAFSEVLAHLPADTGMAFVFVQHLDPKHASVLAELLARSSSMPVKEIRDGTPVEPNHVYVISPNANLIVSRGVLRLSPRSGAGAQMSIDLFFESLAAEE